MVVVLSRFECYELCVQSPRHVVELLRSVHGNEPRILGEDFCGTAAVSRRWVADGAKAGERWSAVAVDLDPEVLEFARERGGEVALLRGDAVGGPASEEPADVIFVGNFSIGYLHARAELLRYMRQCRARLEKGNGGFGGGIVAVDTYGGAGAFRLGVLERRHPGRGPEIIRYAWRHEAADPLTSMVENSIGFRVEVEGEVVQELARAFVYRWRLWSIAELREAMVEAGFAATEVYADLNIAPGQPAMPVADPAHLGEDWIVVVVGRV